VPDPAAHADIEAIAPVLRHYDPAQLHYQLGEIVGERTYLRHGIDVHQGDVVLDVGANVGVTAAFFAAVCRAGAVHCYEPIPRLYELLSQNVAHFPGCSAHPYGLSSSDRRATITYYPAAAAMSSLYADPEADRALVRRCLLNLGMSEERVEEELDGRYEATRLQCELRALSSVLREESLDRVDLLKIDVEKAELDVLAGLDDRDWPRIRQVVAEVHDLGARLETIRRMLEQHGFIVIADQAEIMRGTPIHMVYATRP
jgi:31-O-methyltransferase